MRKSQMRDPINWRLFWILFSASIFGVIAVIPYTLVLQADLLKELPIPLHILLPIQILQNALLFAFFIFAGLYLSKKVGLGVPILEAWLEGKKAKAYLKSISGYSIALGAVVGSLIAGIDSLFSIFVESITIAAITNVYPSPWQGFLASFYGGINEEIAMRLFFVTLLVWMFHKIKRTKEGKPTDLAVWLAVIMAAVLFGIGHLPFAVTVTSLTPLMVARIIFLNSIGGIVFGWLYWRKGLESAILSHFSTDIVLHVILPLLSVR